MALTIDSNGYFVVCPNGRIGLTVDDKPHAMLPHRTVITVTFGASGPYHDFLSDDLRYATGREVIEAGLHGVGGELGPRHQKRNHQLNKAAKE